MNYSRMVVACESLQRVRLKVAFSTFVCKSCEPLYMHEADYSEKLFLNVLKLFLWRNAR